MRLRAWGVSQLPHERVGMGRQVMAAALTVVMCLALTALLVGWGTAETDRAQAPDRGALPAAVLQPEPLPLERAPVLSVAADGNLRFNGRPVPSGADELVLLLKRYRAAARAAKVPPTLVVEAEPATPFETLGPVLGVCTAAGIRNVRLMY